MFRRLFFGTLVVLLVLFSSGFGPNCGNFNVSAAPLGLNIYLGPSSVFADNSVYNNIFVQLQDVSGAPVRASTDTVVMLSSSAANVGSVDSSITIPKGSTGTQANFHSTYTPGSTTITASSSGYVSGQAVIATVGTTPTTLAVYPLPALLPADGNSYAAILVQLQDSSGAPAQAPIGGVRVTLFSSNAAAGTVDASVTILGGTNYAMANIRTASNVTGQTTVTAIATGYVSGQITFTIQAPTQAPSRLQLYLGPPKIPADGITKQKVVVELTDSNGIISKSVTDLAVTLSLSSPDQGSINPTIVIPIGKTFELASFVPTYKPGITSITAVASGFTSSLQFLTTTGSVPSRLAVFSFPRSLPANGQSYAAFVVQLQDNLGNPAKDPVGSTVVSLTSSNPEVGNLVSSTLTIPFGQTQITGVFQTSLVAGSTTITAPKVGYGTGQTTLTTYAIDQSPLSLSVSSNQTTINAGKSVSITAYVSLADNTPVTGANVQLASNGPGTFLSPIDEGNGTYLSIFTPPSISGTSTFTITVSASKQGYATASRTLQITVTGINALVTASPATLNAGKSSTITVQVTYPDRTPVLGASMQLSSNLGGSFSALTETGNGFYSSIFTPPSFSNTVTCTITATVSSSVGTTVGTTSITINGIMITVTADPVNVHLGSSSRVVSYVSFADGSPVVGASVFFSSNNTGSFSSAAFDEGNGYYSSMFMPSTTSGTCEIVANALFSGSSASARTTVSVIGMSATVSADPVTVHFGGSSNITAYVSFADGSPVVGANVLFSSNDTGSFSSAFDEGNGYYSSRFVPPTVSGTSLIAAKILFSGNSVSAKTSVQVIGITTALTANPSIINDGESTNLTAYVTYADQTPAVGASVQFVSNKGGYFSIVIDKGNGYYVSTFTPIRIAQTTNFTIVATASLLGSQSNASVQLKDVFNSIKTGTIQLQVTDENGNPISQANVTSISQPVGMTTLLGNTDAAGNLTFANIPEGPYQIQIAKSGFAMLNVTITVSSGQTAHQAFTLLPESAMLSSQTIEILAVAIVAVVVGTVALIVLIRQRKSSDIAK